MPENHKTLGYENSHDTCTIASTTCVFKAYTVSIKLTHVYARLHVTLTLHLVLYLSQFNYYSIIFV